jgi:hypothetical protein
MIRTKADLLAAAKAMPLGRAMLSWHVGTGRSSSGSWTLWAEGTLNNSHPVSGTAARAVMADKKAARIMRAGCCDTLSAKYRIYVRLHG